MASDWREIIDNQMALSERRTPRRSMAVNYPNDLYALVMESARRRDLSMTAYQRRAALSFAQWDLGFDWAETMQSEPPVGRFTASQARLILDGTGFGAWRIVDLRDVGTVE